MSLTITYTLDDFDKGEIVDKYGLGKDGDLRLFLANNCFRRMVKYTPWREGIMATHVTVKPGKVIYEQDYANYQYRGARRDGSHPVRKYTKKGTSSYWPEKMFNAEKDVIVQELEAEAQRLGRRL